MKTALKLFLFAASFVFAVILLTVAAIWAEPGRVLHEKNVKRALDRFAPELNAGWAGFRLRFEPRGWLGKRVELELDELCVKNSPRLNACVAKLRLDFSFSLSGFSPRITELTELQAHVRHLHVTTEKSGEGEAGSPLPSLKLPAYPDFLTGFPLSEVFELRVDQFSVGTEGDPHPLHGSLRLGRAGPPAAGKMGLALEGKIAREGSLHLNLALKINATPSQAAVNGKIQGMISGWKVRSPIEGTWAAGIQAKLRPVLRKGSARPVNLSLTVDSTPERMLIQTGSIGLPALLPGRQLTARECGLSIQLDNKQGYPADTRIRCRLHASAPSYPSPVKELGAELESKIQFRVKASRLVAGFDLQLHSEHELFRAQISGSGQAELSPSMSLERLVNPVFVAEAKVPRFELLSEALRGSAYAVPAPFHSLSGTIDFRASLEKSSGRDLEFQVKLDSSLRSQQQSFVTTSAARVVITEAFSSRRFVSIDAQSNLANVQLEAPPLRLGEPPQAMLDKRFQAGAARRPAPKKENLTWKLALRTEQPLRIRTNLLAAPIPFAIDLRLAANRRPEGSVEVRPMPVEIFHRKAELEKVRLTFRQNTSSVELNGLLLYRNPEALVRILLLGNTAEPRVVFESEPPLSQQQVVSLLLFNKSVHELNEEEAASSSSMSQALADGALGLVSLLFLSSTPVESVGYDPVSDTYSVRVRLGSGTTASVASDFQGDRQYAIRRRLGRRWAVRTELQRDEERGNTALLTLIEWFNRF